MSDEVQINKMPDAVVVYVVKRDGSRALNSSSGIPCGIFWFENMAEAEARRLGPDYSMQRYWAIPELSRGSTRVLLLGPADAMMTPKLQKIGVIFHEEKQRIRLNAIQKLTAEELEALGVDVKADIF